MSESIVTLRPFLPLSTPSLVVRLRRVGTVLELCYRLRPVAGVIVAQAMSSSGFVEGLWQSTCFEVFVQSIGASAYDEWNMAPSGAWAAFRFAEYRQRSLPQPEWSPPKSTITKSADELQLSAVIEVPPGPLRLGVSAVLQHQNTGELSYWALSHGKERPDFHTADAWTELV